MVEDAKSKGGTEQTVEEDLPQIIYKYRCWSRLGPDGKRIPEAFHQNILLKCEIFFASPKSFNDPFDLPKEVRYDKLTKWEKMQKLKRHRRQEDPTLGPKEVNSRARRVYKKRMWVRPEIVRLSREQDAESVGVFSATARKDSILMWSHYADSHRGFCVGFDRERLQKHLDMLTTEDQVDAPVFVIHPVTYAKVYPSPDPREADKLEQAKQIYSTKAEDWSYEREIRLMVLERTDFGLRLPDEVYSELIFGLRMCPEEKKKIAAHVRQHLPHVKIWQAAEKRREFTLEFKKYKD